VTIVEKKAPLVIFWNMLGNFLEIPLKNSLKKRALWRYGYGISV
jgi:hypothetical protein